MNELIRPTLLILIPALNTLGVWLKGKKVTDTNGIVRYPKQKVPSHIIPFVLLGTAIVFCIIENLVSGSLLGWRLILNSLSTGAVEGLVCTGIAVFGYDVIKGVTKRD